MRIKVKVHGHQYYSEAVGEVLLWCMGVEHYRTGHLQVPAVLLDTGESVELVTLQRDLYWTKIETLPVETTQNYPCAANVMCTCGKRFGEHPIAPPWWPCMVKSPENRKGEDHAD